MLHRGLFSWCPVYILTHTVDPLSNTITSSSMYICICGNFIWSIVFILSSLVSCSYYYITYIPSLPILPYSSHSISMYVCTQYIA